MENIILTLASRPIDAYRVVIGKEATEHEKEAADELVAYLEKTTGKKLALVTDEAPATDAEILVGVTTREPAEITNERATLKNDGILIRVLGGKLYLTSESRLGTRYAVYKFLEKYVGWRYYDEKNERCVGAGKIDLPEGLHYGFSSPLLYRQTDWQVGAPLNHKRGQNAGVDIENTIVGFCHTMGALSEMGDGNADQPCLSDEKVFQTVLKNVRKWIDEHPGCRIISVTQNDNDRYCKCEKCRAVTDKEGQSGMMLTFVNRLADEIAKDHPEVFLLTFAYWYTRKPPVTIKPRDNVIIWLCSIECCFSHPLNAPCERNTAFAKDIADWAKIAKRIYIWDYTTNYSRYVSPFPDLFTLYDNANFFVNNSAIAIYEEGDYQQKENGEFRSLRSYLIGQLLWDPFMSREHYLELMDDFLEGYYGAGWKYVREYIDKTSAKAAEGCLGIFDDTKKLFTKADGQIDGDFCRETYGLWEKAIAAATDERTRTNCENSSCQAYYMVATAAWLENGKPDADKNVNLLRMCKRAGIVRICEWAGKYGTFDFLTEEVATRIAPPDWKELGSQEFREKNGIAD